MNQTKTRAELKSEAKDLLRGRWRDAILLNLVPTILKIGAFIIGIFFLVAAVIFLTIFMQKFTGNTGSIDNSYYGTNYGSGSGSGGGIIGFFLSLISIGISFTFLDWLRQPSKKIEPFRDAFQVYTGKNFVKVVVIMILNTIFTFFWALLFVIPGIIKSIAYSQSYFIYKDISDSNKNQEMRYTDYITASRKLMDGHKWDYFVLQLSFIGWQILCLCTFGIGYLWLNPYMSATYAAFYKDLSKDRYLDSVSEVDEWTTK